MPTHWESSERPLFVKTVIVNGNRHAILSEVDPLCQVRKPESCNGYATVSHCLDLARDDLSLRRARSCYPAKKDISSDLQNCLVKLRVALSTQENKKNAKRDLVYLNEDEKLKSEKKNENWKNLKKNLKRIKKSSKYSTFSDTSSNTKEDDTPGLKKEAGSKGGREKDHEDYREIITNISGRNEIIPESGIKDPTDVIMKKQEHTNSVQNILPLTDSAEEIFRNYSNYFFPIMYIKANVIPWDDEQSKNLLSERVLQWMHLAGKRKTNIEEANPEINENKEPVMKSNSECTRKLVDRIQERKENKGCCNNLAHKQVKDSGFESQFTTRKPDEDVEEEVRQESDIETVLSSSTTQECPKFSKELNKQHLMKFSEEELFEQKEEDPTTTECYWEGSMLSIPERESSEFSITEQLQQSILNSFEAIVSLERRTEPEKTYSLLRSKSTSTPTKAIRRKGLHMKQASIRMSSDEDETELKETRRKSRKNYRDPRKLWEHKRKYKYLGQRLTTKDSNDENEEPTEESIHILYNEKPLNKGGRSWASDLAGSRPQLHIFMPGIDSKFLESQEESASDAESYSK